MNVGLLAFVKSGDYILIYSGFEDVYGLIADFEKGFTRLRHLIYSELCINQNPSS